MKILLVGEFSRLHNSLKEGLMRLGPTATIVGTGDDFKGYDVDYSIYPKWLMGSKISFKLKNLFYRITGNDQHFDFFLLQKIGDLLGVVLNRRNRLHTIRHTCGVAKIDDIFKRQSIHQRPHNGQATNPRIKNTNRMRR